MSGRVQNRIVALGDILGVSVLFDILYNKLSHSFFQLRGNWRLAAQTALNVIYTVCVLPLLLNDKNQAAKVKHRKSHALINEMLINVPRHDEGFAADT